MDIPWKSLAAVEKDREYLALLSYLPLNRYSKIFAFMRFSGQINKQLRATPGAIGYSMRAKLFTRRFWTLSVWERFGGTDGFRGQGAAFGEHEGDGAVHGEDEVCAVESFRRGGTVAVG